MNTRHMASVLRWIPAWLLAAGGGALLAALLTLTPFAPVHVGSTAATALPPAHASWAFNLGGHRAPGFTLLDQFGHSRSLASYRGREVALVFVDDTCNGVCPLTAQMLRRARSRLTAGQQRQIALVAVNANPLHTSVAAVYRWSQQHGMLHRWDFLTGSPATLHRIYAAYRIYDVITAGGNVTHDAAVVLIDAQGRERQYFNAAPSAARPTVTSEEAAYTSGMSQVLTAR